MKDIQYAVRTDLSFFVNSIFVHENTDPQKDYCLPLYADGYPGIMFQQSQNGFYRLPKNKKLSDLFLYGQTIDPITLEVRGTYRFIVFQLYPFASKYLLGVDPKQLNDECYDLLQLRESNFQVHCQQIADADNMEQLVEIMSNIVAQLINQNRQLPNDRIQHAIKQIIQTEGRIRIKDLSDGVFLTERTLERNFLAEVGLTPKQFAKIIQFQNSLTKLSESDHETLTAIGLDSGFTDQSHFIRVFKEYSGQTPSSYIKNNQVR